MEAKISETQSELAEAVEAAQEVAAYEPDEDETVTAAVIKKALKELIDDLKDSTRRIGAEGTQGSASTGKSNRRAGEAYQGDQSRTQDPDR